MKLYYFKGACSLGVRILIHELNISMEFEAIDPKTKQTETGADYLKINAKGAVPALLLDNKDVLTENAVIQQYLADTHHATHLLPPIGDVRRYHVLEWLNFIGTDLHKTCAPLFNPKLPQTIKDEFFKPLLENKLHFVNQHLHQNKYICDSEFTIADCYLFVILLWLPNFKMEITEWPHLARYFDDMQKRPAVILSLKEEGLRG